MRTQEAKCLLWLRVSPPLWSVSVCRSLTTGSLRWSDDFRGESRTIQLPSPDFGLLFLLLFVVFCSEVFCNSASYYGRLGCGLWLTTSLEEPDFFCSHLEFTWTRVCFNSFFKTLSQVPSVARHDGRVEWLSWLPRGEVGYWVHLLRTQTVFDRDFPSFPSGV